MGVKLKAGIIGCGNIFPMHAASLEHLDATEIAAVCDIKEDRAIAASKKYNCDYYTNYKKMIDEAGIDAVHICTPHNMHAPMAIFAAKAKKHVITEKPMAIEYHDAVEMVNAAKENGVTLGVIFQNHYNLGSRLIKDTLQSGGLGKILSARAIVTWNRSDEYYGKSDWKGTWDKEGGGVVIDQAIHTLDLMRWFINSEIEYVDAQISNRAHDIIQVEDSAEGVIKFKNNVFAAFFAINYYAYDAPVEIELYCENGTAKMFGSKATIQFKDGNIIEKDNDNKTISYGSGVKSYWGQNHVKQIENFYNSILTGVKPEIDGEYGLMTQKMISAIYNSGKTSKRIFFDI